MRKRAKSKILFFADIRPYNGLFYFFGWTSINRRRGLPVAPTIDILIFSMCVGTSRTPSPTHPNPYAKRDAKTM